MKIYYLLPTLIADFHLPPQEGAFIFICFIDRDHYAKGQSGWCKSRPGGPWVSGSIFSGLMGHNLPSGSLTDESRFNRCPVNCNEVELGGREISGYLFYLFIQEKLF